MTGPSRPVLLRMPPGQSVSSGGSPVMAGSTPVVRGYRNGLAHVQADCGLRQRDEEELGNRAPPAYRVEKARRNRSRGLIFFPRTEGL
ncbi:hypothetical protein EAO73_12430 [Streptomyces sp. col6]|nr:hypothetical protein EAO73_12430 [Streptomyces sp. col6]